MRGREAEAQGYRKCVLCLSLGKEGSDLEVAKRELRLREKVKMQGRGGWLTEHSP